MDNRRTEDSTTTRDHVAWLLERGIWPVRGGGPADDEGELTAEERKNLTDMRAWRRKQHAEDERLKAERERLDEDRGSTKEQSRELAALRAEVAEMRGGARGNGQSDDDADYPDPVDDPAGFKTRAQREAAELRKEIKALTQTVAGLTGKVNDTGRNVAATVNGASAYHRVAARNDQLFEDFATDNALSESDMDDLREYVQAFRIKDRGYGGYAAGATSPEGNQIWQYTKQALAQAANAAFPEKFRDSVRAEERAALEKERGPGPASNKPMVFGQGGVPAKDAPIEELTEYYYSLPEGSADLIRFSDSLETSQLKEMMTLRTNQEAEALGYGPEAPGQSPLGVQNHIVEVL